MPERSGATGLYDPRAGDEPVRVSDLEMTGSAVEPPRTNCFSVYLIEAGSGQFWADAARFQFAAPALLFFVPYQHIRLQAETPVRGRMIQFHANFLCVETFHAEVGCSGVLFNDPHGVPIVPLDRRANASVRKLVDGLQQEQAGQQLACHEVMLAQLKILLILATRWKAAATVERTPAAHDPRHPLLIAFRDLIEQHYRTWHTPADYARPLHITAKTLGRLVRDHLGTTPSELIRARILTHAKWQLLHTLRPVKEIAREVGFTDELYFSRLFKKATGVSPTYFREYETEIRGGSNLSMLLSPAPILPAASPVDTSGMTNP